MSNYEHYNDKLTARLEELKRKHRDLDTLIETKYYNHSVTDEVRRLKTQKLWLKDEIHRIETMLLTEINGSN
jgi:hypothetical protein